MNPSESKFNIIEKKLHTRLEIWLVCISTGLYLLFAFGLAPLTDMISNDKTIGIPYIANILDILQVVLNVAAFFTCYAIVEYSLCRFKFSKAVIFVTTFSVATLLKYGLYMVSSFFIFDSVPSTSEALKNAIGQFATNALIELAQFLIVTVLSFFIINKHKKVTDIAVRKAEKIGVDFDPRTRIFPFKKLLSFKNPLQFSAFITATVVSSFMIVNRLIYDIWLIFNLNQGLPGGWVDVLWMIVGYGSDILCGIVGYFIMIFILNKADTQDLTLKVKSM